MESSSHERTMQRLRAPSVEGGHCSNCHHSCTPVQICMLELWLWHEPSLINCVLHVGTFASSLILTPQPVPTGRFQASQSMSWGSDGGRFRSVTGFPVTQLLKLRAIRLSAPAILAPWQGVCVCCCPGLNWSAVEQSLYTVAMYYSQWLIKSWLVDG